MEIKVNITDDQPAFISSIYFGITRGNKAEERMSDGLNQITTIPRTEKSALLTGAHTGDTTFYLGYKVQITNDKIYPYFRGLIEYGIFSNTDLIIPPITNSIKTDGLGYMGEFYSAQTDITRLIIPKGILDQLISKGDENVESDWIISVWAFSQPILDSGTLPTETDYKYKILIDPDDHNDVGASTVLTFKGEATDELDLSFHLDNRADPHINQSAQLSSEVRKGASTSYTAYNNLIGTSNACIISNMHMAEDFSIQYIGTMIPD